MSDNLAILWRQKLINYRYSMYTLSYISRNFLIFYLLEYNNCVMSNADLSWYFDALMHCLVVYSGLVLYIYSLFTMFTKRTWQIVLLWTPKFVQSGLKAVYWQTINNFSREWVPIVHNSMAENWLPTSQSGVFFTIFWLWARVTDAALS